MNTLTRRQREIFNFLRDNADRFAHPADWSPGNPGYMNVPDALKTGKPCHVLQVKGDSMIEAGIFDGDWVVIEQRAHSGNGEIVVALIDSAEVTLKYIEQSPERVLLLPANANPTALSHRPEQVEIQGALVGQMRRYRAH